MNKDTLNNIVLAQLDFIEQYPKVMIPLPDEAIEAQIRMASYTVPHFRGNNAPMRQIDIQDLPEALDALCQAVVSKYSAGNVKAIGLSLCQAMNTYEGLIPTVMARNHGQCMMAIDRNIDISSLGMEPARSWFGDGDETRLDEAQAIAQLFLQSPDLVPVIHHSAVLDRDLAALARVGEEELGRVRYGQESRHDQLMRVGQDVPVFLQAVVEYGTLGATYEASQFLGNIYHVLGLLEPWGLEEPTFDANKITQLRAVDMSDIKLSATQQTGKLRLDRMALAAIARGVEKPRERGGPKM